MKNSVEGVEKVRHSLAHVLAMAVLTRDPDAKLAIGPAIENGFYYDFELTTPLSQEHLPKLEKEMRKILSKNLGFEKIETTPQEAQEQFRTQPYKLELIEEIKDKGEGLTLYTTGEFVDLCRGGHVDSTKEINPEGFVLTHIAGAYWRGDENNTMLTRIYGLAFETKEELESYIEQQEEAKKRDHKKLGRELDLFVFSDTVGKGLPLWTPKGATIRRELERFIVDEEIRRGYLHVFTPDIAKIDLFEKSGHYPHYKESMYAPIAIDDEEYMLRPMTCPHHFELYLSKPRSYRDLPMRIAEIAHLYRYEQSGELSGLQRVRTFSLADAHIVCASEEQAMEEIDSALDLIEYVAGVFGLTQGENYWYRLSLGNRNDSEKYFKNDSAWEKGETLLRELLTKRGCTFIEAPDEAAFYGPKIDIQMKNVNGKEDTAFTVQYDFCMPQRFNLTYRDSDGKEKQVFVVHRSSIGAIERIVAFLIEHFAGAFPLWLSPIQVRVLPIGESHKDYAQTVTDTLKAGDLRAEIDLTDESLGKKIRNGKTEKIPYLLIVGDQEVSTQTITVESRDAGNLGALSTPELLTQLTQEVTEKR